jgi:hypothetical protein
MNSRRGESSRGSEASHAILPKFSKIHSAEHLFGMGTCSSKSCTYIRTMNLSLSDGCFPGQTFSIDFDGFQSIDSRYGLGCHGRPIMGLFDCPLL